MHSGKVIVSSLVGLLGLGALSACEPADAPRSDVRPPVAQPSTPPAPEPVYSAPAPAVTPSVTPSATRAPVASAVLLVAARGGDGDSWKDTQGREYRLGLVNTPETGECFGAEATRTRKRLVAGGFRATAYARDAYGRAVSVVTLPDGTNLNVYLARHGFADDRYLEEFRSENPRLAAQLDVAFAAAKGERAGLWAGCAAAPQPVVAAPAQDACHPDYATCIPVKGDGSGTGEANDLDCPDIGKRVRLRQAGVDPYRLDNDDDGFGCDSY